MMAIHRELSGAWFDKNRSHNLGSDGESAVRFSASDNNRRKCPPEPRERANVVGGFGKRTGIGFSRRMFFLLVKVTGEAFLGFIGVGVGPASRVACRPSAEPKNALQSVFDGSASENKSKAGLEK